MDRSVVPGPLLYFLSHFSFGASSPFNRGYEHQRSNMGYKASPVKKLSNLMVSGDLKTGIRYAAV